MDRGAGQDKDQRESQGGVETRDEETKRIIRGVSNLKVKGTQAKIPVD
jgi:hypothetical protein